MPEKREKMKHIILAIVFLMFLTGSVSVWEGPFPNPFPYPIPNPYPTGQETQK